MSASTNYLQQFRACPAERTLHEHASDAFEFHLVKRPQMDERIRLPQDQTVGDLSPAELLEKFWQASHVPPWRL